MILYKSAKQSWISGKELTDKISIKPLAGRIFLPIVSLVERWLYISVVSFLPAAHPHLLSSASIGILRLSYNSDHP